MTAEAKEDGHVVRVEFGKPGEPGKATESMPITPEPAEQGFVEALYRNNFAELCRTLRRLYGSGPPEPEDIVQQAFEKMQSLRSVGHIENPRAFLFTVAINLGLKSIRRIQRERTYVGEQLQKHGIGVEEIDPARLYQSKEQVLALEAAMATLPPKQREIIIRSRFHGHTYAEISRTTGWSEADISRQLNAALKVLMKAVVGSPNQPRKPANSRMAGE